MCGLFSLLNVVRHYGELMIFFLISLAAYNKKFAKDQSVDLYF